MGLHRYFTDIPLAIGRFSLPAEEAHHALRVRRETTGNTCVVFDGHGNEAVATIGQTSKRECEAIIEKVVFAPRDLPRPFTLGVALPKGERLRAVIEKSVELGVTTLVPILCERSVKIPHEGSMDKLERLVIEACKQCERNRLMKIELPMAFKDWVDTVNSSPNSSIQSLRILAHPDLPAYAHSMQKVVTENLTLQPQRGWAAIGPEGGFTSQEAEYAHTSGWKLIDLGSRILRVETAVASIATLASVLFDDRQDLNRAPKEDES